MVFEQYKMGDIWKVLDRDLIIKNGFDVIEESIADITNAWIAYDKGIFIGCAGFRYFWKGVYEAWLASISYELLYSHKLEIVRFIKAKISELPAHRIQATVMFNSLRDAKFLRCFGFKFEGLLRQYGPNQQDYAMFALVK